MHTYTNSHGAETVIIEHETEMGELIAYRLIETATGDISYFQNLHSAKRCAEVLNANTWRDVK